MLLESTIADETKSGAIAYSQVASVILIILCNFYVVPGHASRKFTICVLLQYNHIEQWTVFAPLFCFILQLFASS